MRSFRYLLAGLVIVAPLLLNGCSMPHVMGMGSYYQVTDPASSRVYYTEKIKRRSNGVVEFIDPVSDAVISVPKASVRKISKAEFQDGRRS